MNEPVDRSAEVYRDAVRALTLERKLEVAGGLWELAWEFQRNRVRTEHPGWSAEQVDQQVGEVFLRVSS